MAAADCIRTCRNCGKEFVRAAKGLPTKYCGHDCRIESKRAKDRARPQRAEGRKPGCCSICGKPALAKGLCPAHYFRAKSTGCVLRECRVCGKPTDARGCCSDECRLSSVRAIRSKQNAIRRMAVDVGDRIDPIKVFERDKWRCHICGGKTHKGKRGTCDPKAPELDHIVTLAEGGTHTWGNVACACKACNMAKGARSKGQLGLGLAA